MFSAIGCARNVSQYIRYTDGYDGIPEIAALLPCPYLDFIKFPFRTHPDSIFTHTKSKLANIPYSNYKASAYTHTMASQEFRIEMYKERLQTRPTPSEFLSGMSGDDVRQFLDDVKVLELERENATD